MMPKLAAIVAACLIVAGCQQSPVRDESSPRSRIPVDSVIVLEKPLTIPAGHARVFLQGGKVKAKSKINRYHPHCNFETRQLSDGTLTIEPDRFIVTQLVGDETEIVHQQGPLRYAALRRVGGEAFVSQTSRFIEHYLDSEKQPGVMRMTCHGGFGEPWLVKYPSVAEIRKALGEYVRLKLARIRQT